jgi:hypothetical protein
MESNAMQNQDVVVSVVGGCVNGVFTDIPGVRVVVLDWDNINDAPFESLSAGIDRNFPLNLLQMPSDARLAYECLISTSKATAAQ